MCTLHPAKAVVLHYWGTDYRPSFRTALAEFMPQYARFVAYLLTFTLLYLPLLGRIRAARLCPAAEFPPSVYRFYEPEEVESLLAHSGFQAITSEVSPDRTVLVSADR